MHFTSNAAILAFAISGALAAPAISKRGGGHGGEPRGPPPGDTCSSGSNLCNNGNNVWFAKKTTSDCETGSTYCCSSMGKDNLLNCVNALNGNNLPIGVSDLLALRKRNEKGHPEGPPPPSSVCSSGSNFCNNGNNVWFAKKTESDCSTGSTYCCSSSGETNALNCVDALNGNSLSVGLADLLSGLRKRTDGSEYPEVHEGSQSPPPSSTCSSGSNFCNNGNKAFFAKKTESDCSTGSTYCCDSSSSDVNALNCVSLLNGNSVSVDISDLVGSVIAKRTEGGYPSEHGGKMPPPPSNTCSSGSNFCNNGNSAWFAKGTESDCETGSTYCCNSESDNLNALNCVNALNGNNVSVSLGDLF